MSKLLFLLLFTSSLFASSIYTLDNITKLGIYFMTDANFITKEKKEELQQMVKEKLVKTGFIFGQTDSQLFIVKIDGIEVEDTYVINIEVGISENVLTKREDNIETYAYTYKENKFFEAFEPYEDTRETLMLLVNNFIEAYLDDKEE